MILPEFFMKRVKSTLCIKCKRGISITDQVAVQGAILKRAAMKEPHFSATVECPFCGRSQSFILPLSIPWCEVINWILDVAVSQPAGEHRNDAVEPHSIPKNERLWVVHNGLNWVFHIIGGYRRGEMVYVMGRRIPLQPAGWDGYSWDAVLRIVKNLRIIIVGEDDPSHIPSSDWLDFSKLPPGTEFRLASETWNKLTNKKLNSIAKAGVYRSIVPD